jgi:hypothetical protein
MEAPFQGEGRRDFGPPYRQHLDLMGVGTIVQVYEAEACAKDLFVA